jgi:hypothetical protein
MADLSENLSVLCFFDPEMYGLSIAVSAVPSITYSACLMCWSAAQQKLSEFCSISCQEAAQDNGPILLEALRGHVTFQESE